MGDGRLVDRLSPIPLDFPFLGSSSVLGSTVHLTFLQKPLHRPTLCVYSVGSVSGSPEQNSSTSLKSLLET